MSFLLPRPGFTKTVLTKHYTRQPAKSKQVFRIFPGLWPRNKRAVRLGRLRCPVTIGKSRNYLEREPSCQASSRDQKQSVDREPRSVNPCGYFFFGNSSSKKSFMPLQERASASVL